jgi:hypothetical protein
MRPGDIQEVPDGKPQLSERTNTWRILLMLTAAAILVRLASASLRGFYLGFDESMYIILGRNLLSGHGYTLNDLPNATFPFLISIFSGAADMVWGPRWALSLPSAVLGGAALIPLYLLTRRMASRTVAFAAVLVFVGFPALIRLTPYLSYARLIYEGSEQIYLFFFLFAAYFVWCAGSDGAWKDYILAGAFCGLASEVRQDALLYGALAFVWLVAVAVAQRQWKSLPRVAAFAVAAFLVALPFVVHVRMVTGLWGTGPRFAKTFLMRDTFTPVMKKNQWKAALASYFQLNDDGTELETSYYGVSPWHRRHLAEGYEQVGIRKALSGMRPGNLVIAWRGFHKWIAPNRFAFLALVGLVAACICERRWLILTFLLTLIVPALVTAMLLYPLMRFWVFLAPFVALFFAWGLVFACEQVARRFHRVSGKGAIIALALAGVVALAGAWTGIKSQKKVRDRDSFDHAAEVLQKDGGEWLTANTPPAARVMATSPQATLMAGRTWLALPIADGAHILKYALAKRADYIVRTVSGAENNPSELAGALVTILSTQTQGYHVRLYIYDLHKLTATGEPQGDSAWPVR